MAAQLPEATYEITPDYGGTNVYRAGPVGTFTVSEGQLTNTSFNLKLGHIKFEVVDASGARVDKARLSVYVYTAGERDTLWAWDNAQNPLDVALRAGESYDIVVSLDSLKATLSAQTIGDGDTRVIRLNAADFK